MRRSAHLVEAARNRRIVKCQPSIRHISSRGTANLLGLCESRCCHSTPVAVNAVYRSQPNVRCVGSGCGCVVEFNSSILQTQQRTIHTTTTLRQTWAMQGLRPWMCIKEECRAVNPGRAPACTACGEEKPILKGWKCVECATKNHKGVKACRQCHAPYSKSAEYWMCAACNENNRVDTLDDNSRCGFCGYDMAPMTMTEEEAMHLNQERSEKIRNEQNQFDSISADAADEQFGSVERGPYTLPDSASASTNRFGAPPPHPGKSFKIPTIAPFAPSAPQTRHTRIAPRGPPKPIVPIPEGPPGFDWMCRERDCGQTNAGDDEVCSTCGTHITPSNWECLECAAQNHQSRSMCFNCRCPIPISWRCTSCNTLTSIYDGICRQCGTSRPPTEPKEVRDVVMKARHTSSARPPRGRRPDWGCPGCNAHNFGSRTVCYQCGSPRGNAPDAYAGTADGSEAEQGVVASHNTWGCPQCQASNFRTRSSCWQCGASAPGSAANTWNADESAPVFQQEGFQKSDDADDEGGSSVWAEKPRDEWVCSKCFTRNFKSRKECHKCGTVKMEATAPRKAFVRKPVKL